MTHDVSPLDSAGASFGAGRRLSRRSLLAGLGAGAAAIAVARTGSSAGAVAGQFNEAGIALEQASRVSPPTTTSPTTSTTSSTTTTTSTTSTTSTTVPTDPDSGEIRFPIVVGEDDTCYVGRNFGACRSGCSRRHEGIDIMADQGLDVIAVVDGTLTTRYDDSGSCGGAGNGWKLADSENNVIYKYFHLDSLAEGLEEGDSVTAGQVIGYVGETGTSGVCSTSFNNYHLHFEYRPNDVATDPFDLFERPEHVIFAS